MATNDDQKPVLPTESTPVRGKTVNEKFYARGQKALKDRIDWERKLARMQLQRFCQDRVRVNNNPWPRASNVRFPLSDTIISQKKPFFFKLLYTSERIPFFKAMLEKNIQYTEGCAAYLDFIVKEQTDFEAEIQYCADAGLQDGETVMKTVWDVERQVPVFEQIDNLFIITPTNTRTLDESPWVIHVRQFDEAEFVREFSKYTKQGQTEEQRKSELRSLAKRVKDSEVLENDQADREEDEYTRQGINRTVKGGKLVVWEIHYEDEDGAKRLRSMIPDTPQEDLLDDRQYPYEYKRSKWMFAHYRLERTNKKLHSARGIPELVQDGEHSLTSMWRAKHNAMALALAPIYTGTLPGSTQNISLAPGSFVPGKLELVRNDYPFTAWDQEMQQTRSVWERRAGSPDFGIGKGNDRATPRTAREVMSIQQQESMGVELDAGNWKMFIREIMRQAWSLVCQFKPQSLLYYLNEQMQTLPAEALNDDYIIGVSGSAEATNKEWMVQKAAKLWEAAKGNPFANMGESYKALLQVLVPGEVQRYYTDPQQAQQKAQLKAASDISIMSIGFPVMPQPTDDSLVCAMTAVQWLQAKHQKGEQIDPQFSVLVGRYIAAHREQLKHQSKEGYQQLTQVLAQFEQQSRQPAQPAPAPGQIGPVPMPTGPASGAAPPVSRSTQAPPME